MRRKVTGWGIDDPISGVVAESILSLLKAGKAPEEAVDIASRAVHDALETSAPRVVTSLLRDAPRMLREHRKIERGFERRLRRHWGEAFDLYFSILVCCEEAGANFNERMRPVAFENNDLVFENLTGLHARACRVAYEAYRLLCSGFPLGALSRCRTLHELAVTTMVLGEHGRDSNYPELAERYYLHHHVLNYADALTFQQHHELLNQDPFDDDEIANMKAARDSLVQRYGTAYSTPYGWADGLAGLKRPNFSDLEKLASMTHLRSYYRWASHEIHSDSKGSLMNTAEWGGGTYLTSGMVNFGLAEPGHLALISLTQCTTALLINGSEEPSAMDLLALKSIQLLLDHAGEAFSGGEQSVESAKDRLDAKSVKSQSTNKLRFWR